MPATVGGGWWTSIQRLTSRTLTTSGARDFTDPSRGGGLHAGTAKSSLTVVFSLVIGGLTSDMLVVLGTTSLQFHHPLVPISLWPVLGTVAAHVLGTVWSS